MVEGKERVTPLGDRPLIYICSAQLNTLSRNHLANIKRRARASGVAGIIPSGLLF